LPSLIGMLIAIRLYPRELASIGGDEVVGKVF
jgi:hypothetical protein